MSNRWSVFGILPNTRLGMEQRIFHQECAARLFHRGLLQNSGGIHGGESDSKNGSTNETRHLAADDVIYYVARNYPPNTKEDIQRYMEEFVWPLLPEDSWSGVTIFEPTEEEVKYYMGAVYSENHRVCAVIEARCDQVKGFDWYVMVSCMRLPAVYPSLLKHLNDAKALGMNLSQCWIYSLYHIRDYAFNFLPSTITTWSFEEQLAFDIPKELGALFSKGISLPYDGTVEKNTTLNILGKRNSNIDGAIMNLHKRGFNIYLSSHYIAAFKEMKGKTDA